jgi:8-oxo-dGTP pyrophosphatase MutT (NUDIX family)
MINYNYKLLPKKRMAATVLLFNKYGELLLLKQTDDNEWTLPGGIIDENESPRLAAEREIKEEIGMSIKVRSLVAIDYILPKAERTEGVHFVFNAGTITDKEIELLKLQNKEISGYDFVPPEKAPSLLTEILRDRMLLCIEAGKNNKVIYLEDHKQIF